MAIDEIHAKDGVMGCKLFYVVADEKVAVIVGRYTSGVTLARAFSAAPTPIAVKAV